MQPAENFLMGIVSFLTLLVFWIVPILTACFFAVRSLIKSRKNKEEEAVKSVEQTPEQVKIMRVEKRIRFNLVVGILCFVMSLPTVFLGLSDPADLSNFEKTLSNVFLLAPVWIALSMFLAAKIKNRSIAFVLSCVCYLYVYSLIIAFLTFR